MEALLKTLNQADLFESLELLEKVRKEREGRPPSSANSIWGIHVRTTMTHSQFLFKHDLPTILLIVSHNTLYVFSSQDKSNLRLDEVAYVKSIQAMLDKRTSGEIRYMELFEKNTDGADGGLGSFLKHILSKVSGNQQSKPKVSMLINDKQTSRFSDAVLLGLDEPDWKDHTSPLKDATEFMNELLTQRRKGDHKYIEVSARAVRSVFQIAIKHIEQAIEATKKVTNSDISESINQQFYMMKTDIAETASGMEGFLNLSFEPSIQSGEAIDLKHQVLSPETPFYKSNCTVSVAMRYLGFNTQATRTLLIDPSEDMVESYNILHEGLKYAGVLLTPGVELREVHSKVLAFLLEKRHSWSEQLSVSFGNGIGLLRREINRTINSKCQARVRDQEVYYLCLGVKDLDSNSGKKYGIVLGDTVRIEGDQGAKTLTDNLIPKHIYYLEVKRRNDLPRETSNMTTSSSSRRVDKDFKNQPKSRRLDENSRSLSSMEANREDSSIDVFKPTTRAQRLREQGIEPEGLTAKMSFIEHQKHLHKLKQQELRTRLEEGKFVLPGELKKPEHLPKLQEIAAFKKREDCPRLENQNKVQLDMKNNCVWVPLNKAMVPFDIRAVRSITFQHLGKISQLRINFNVPGKTGKLAVRFPDPTDFASPPSYIQELVFKSANRDHYETLVSDFKRMQRDYHPDAAGATRSKALQLESGKRAVLDGVSMKPSFSGKKCGCRLELHANGFRIRTNKEETLDLLFEDIERVVYMPADENQTFVLHFHLKNSVLLGAKAVFDVQVNAQVGITSTDITDKGKKKRRMNEAEEDELFDKMWDQLEEAFDSFVEAVNKRCGGKVKIETCDLDFPITASFNFNSELLYLTESALVCLNCNLPFLFIPFDTVEVAAFERAGQVSKSVDLTFIFKDYSKPTVTIGGIASVLKHQLELALDERDVIVLEGATSLRWSVVLRRIAAELDEFINKQGAWMYFAPKSISGDSSALNRKGGAADENKQKGGTSEDNHSDYEGGSDGAGSWNSDPSGSIDEDDDDEEDSEDSEESFASEDEIDSEESLAYDEEDSAPPKRKR